MQKSGLSKSVFMLISQTTILMRSGVVNSTFREWSRGPLSGFLQLKICIIGEIVLHVFNLQYDVYKS